MLTKNDSLGAILNDLESKERELEQANKEKAALGKDIADLHGRIRAEFRKLPTDTVVTTYDKAYSVERGSVVCRPLARAWDIPIDDNTADASKVAAHAATDADDLELDDALAMPFPEADAA